MEDSVVRQRRSVKGKATDAVTGEVTEGDEIVTKGIDKLRNLKELVGKQVSANAAAVSKEGGSPTRTSSWRPDIAAILLLLAGLGTRLYNLNQPNAVVFDEIHHGKFAAFYMKNQFFFDSQPPLSKQLFAFAAYMAGFDGDFKFEKIGQPYPETVPISQLRLLPAIMGACILPATFWLLRELGVSRGAAVLAGVLMLLENALVTQTRFLFVEASLLLFSILGLLCVARFRRYPSFSGAWFGWFTMGFLLLGAATTVRYSGFLTLLLGCAMVGQDFWRLVPRRDVSGRQLTGQLIVRALVVLTVPVAVYMSSFYVHLSLLYRSGSGHDLVMTSAFQASLEGGLANIIKNQPVVIGHGSQVTLRHSIGTPCWLHSHQLDYPAEVEPERNSSQMQQVSCFLGKDSNNWWIVKNPDTDDIRIGSVFRPVKDGDIVQLVHGITGRNLHVNNIPSPVSVDLGEVACYKDINASLPRNDKWQVVLINPKETDGIWHAIKSQVRLVNVKLGGAVKLSGRTLPEWGQNQHEVGMDGLVTQDDTAWDVVEHRYTSAESNTDHDRQIDIVHSDLIPETAMELSFWRRFWELQLKMLFNNQETVQGHTYASEPLEWLTLTRGVAYWISADSNAQIHLLGNPAVWAASSGALLLYSALAMFYLLRRRRACFDLPDDEWSKMCGLVQTVMAGFLFNFAPYFVIDHTFFLHHYLPAYIFAVMTAACMVDHLFFLAKYRESRLLKTLLAAAVASWLAACVYTFVIFSPLTYGVPALSADELRDLTWRSSWGFIIHK